MSFKLFVVPPSIVRSQSIVDDLTLIATLFPFIRVHFENDL